MDMSGRQHGFFGRVLDWLRTSKELPCGCVIRDNTVPRFSDHVTEVDRVAIEFDVREYRNCTKKKTDWKVTLVCDQCGAEWTTRVSGSTSVDFGAENPDAEMRLETENLANRHLPTRYTEKPIVESAGEHNDA